MSSNEQPYEQEKHEHCEKCYKSFCHMTARPPESCMVISCDLDCGHRFHACKLAEHLQLCQNQRVSCINKDNGCPLFMARKDRGVHLETCPASVIHCTMEWNRWPVYSKERRMRVPFVQDNLHARFGQLDVALALRDQRMLNEGLKAPRSTRRVLRNNLTLRFPAVPLRNNWSTPDTENQLSSASQTISDDDADTPWGLANNPPGLQRSVCSELFRAPQQATQSLTTALHPTTGGEASNGLNGSEVMHNISNSIADGATEIHQANGLVPDRANICEGAAYNYTDGSVDACNAINGPMDESCAAGECDKVNTTNTSLNNHTDIPFTPPPPPPVLPPTLKEILALDLTIEKITRYQAKPKSMYTFLCALEFRRDEYPWHFRNVHNEIHSGLNGWLEHRCPLSHYGCTFSLRRLYPHSKGSSVVYNTAVESFGVRPHIPECHLNYLTNLTDSLENMQTDCEKRSESPRQSTPEIYTSRDYDSIVKVNGNLELITKVNCMNQFTLDNCDQGQNQPDINDKDNQNDICHENGCSDQSSDRLSFMPFEVLQHIASFLDSFSLCNLALTSKLMRDVCCSLLEDRGIVTLIWDRKRVSDRSHWFIAYKKWIFSTAFDPVKQWGFEENIHMSEHLKNCKFFQRIHKMEPCLLPELGSSGTLLHRVPGHMSLTI